ncbi:MAG: peptidyl-prolyl cis-trans isomerase [Neisseriaceae bacterium]|nr:peptidyl-prolyl cis-trans isomerase [Neisseriaceae bacterium]
MKKKLITLTLAVALTGSAITWATLPDTPAATPNISDERVSLALDEQLQAYAANGQMVPEEMLPELFQQVRADLLQKELMMQAAFKQGLDQTPEVKLTYENFESEFYAVELLNQLKQDASVTSEELQAAHKNLSREVIFQQALFPTEAQAKKALADLKAGKTFDTLLQELQQTQQSTEWVKVSGLPAVMSQITGTLQAGQITEEPINLSNQFLLVKLTQERQDMSMPPFEAIQMPLANRIKEEKAQLQVQALLNAAK